MIINPKDAIEHGWIKFPNWIDKDQYDNFIQPNGIDFTLDRLFLIHQNTPGSLRLYQKDFKPMSEIDPINGCWSLKGAYLPPVDQSQIIISLYDGVSDFYVEVPKNVACMLMIRSTLNRMGVQLNAGLYDDSFSGTIGFILESRAGLVEIEHHARVGQIVFMEAYSAKRYAGGYNTAYGQHWKDIEPSEYKQYLEDLSTLPVIPK